MRTYDRHAAARARAADRRRFKTGRPDRRAWSGLRLSWAAREALEDRVRALSGGA